MRQVLSGLPTCKAAGELGEWEQKNLEATVARAVVRAQEVVIEMLHEYMNSACLAARENWTRGGARSGANERYSGGL